MTVVEDEIEILPQAPVKCSPRLKGLPLGIPLSLAFVKRCLVGFEKCLGLFIVFLHIFQSLQLLLRFLASLRCNLGCDWQRGARRVACGPRTRRACSSSP